MAPQYIVVPRIQDSVPSVLYVIVLFVMYLIMVGYIASYDIAYSPNFNMFINMIFDNYDGMNGFNEYIAAVKNEKFTMRGTEDDVPDEGEIAQPLSKLSESFISSKYNPSSVFDRTIDGYMNVKRMMNIAYNRILMTFYMRDKTVRFYRPDL